MNVFLRKFPIVQNIPHLRTAAAQGATSFLDRRILGCVQGQVNAATAATAATRGEGGVRRRRRKLLK